MSIFDAERKKGASPTGGASSIFANERNRQSNVKTYRVSTDPMPSLSNPIIEKPTINGPQVMDEETGTPETTFLQKALSVPKAIDRGVNTFLDAGANSITLGLHNKLLKHNSELDRIENQDGVLGTVGGMVGDIAGINKLAGPISKGIGKLAPNLGRIPKLIGSEVGAGAIWNSGKEALDVAIDTRMDGEQTFGQRAKNVGVNAAIDAGSILGLEGLVAGVKFGKRMANNAVEDFTRDAILQSGDPLRQGLPLGRGDQRLVAASNRGGAGLAESDPIANPYTFALDEVSPQTMNQVKNVKEATDEILNINSELKSLDSGYQKAINDQYQYLKTSAKQDRGGDKGTLLRNKDGEVFDAYGNVSAKPIWYQQALKDLNTKSLNNKQLYELAKKHVDEGFQDDGGMIPPWKSQVNYDETVSALSGVRDQLRSDVKERGLGLTDAPLKSQELGFKSKTPRNEPIVTEPKEVSLRSDPMPEPKSIDEVITVKEPRIRDKVYNYLDEQEKAARARIRSRRNTLSSNPVDVYGDYAIVLASQVGKGTIKLADFTELAVKEFGEDVRELAPVLYRKSLAIIKDTERRATKDAQEARDFNAQDTGDTETFRGKISREIKKEKTPWSKKVETIRSQFEDALISLQSLEKGIRGKLASAEDSLYKSARLYSGMPAKANLIVKERLTPIIEAIEKSGFTSQDLGDYALAVHSKDVNARDIKSGFTNKEIDEVIQKFGTDEMEKARQSLVQVSNDMLKELVDAQVISKDLFDTLKERYPNYIPLFRSMDDEKVEFSKGMSDALANVSSPIKSLKGSEKKVIDPLENMVKNIFQSTNSAERNKVALQLSKLAKEDTESAFIRKLKENEEVGRKNVLNVMENGQRVSYEVEPEIYKAMLHLDREASNILIKALQAPASVLRAGATLTPEFSLRNPMRDVLQAFVVSESGFNPLIDFPIGIIQSIKKGDLYKQWVKDMGDFGNVISMDRDTHADALKRVLKEPVSKKFVNVINGKSLLGILRAIADTSESATKVAEYRAALRQGQTPQEAAYRSRDIMDFARSGSAVKQVNKVVAFLNANIQGKSKLLRAAKANPVGVGARAFTAVTVPTIGVYLAQKAWSNESQKQTIDEAPDWMRNSFWLLPIPGTDQVARIPKPFDLAAIFANAPERALAYVYDNDKTAFDKFMKQSLSDMALPGQISGLLPFIEGMANYSFFRQGDIIPLGEQGRKYEDQYDINTTETGKALAWGARQLTGGEGAFKNFSSPRIADNTIKGLTAGLGTYATSAIDAILEGMNITDNPVKPAKGPAQQPLAKAFLVNPLQSGKSMDKFYDLKDKLSKEKSSATLNGETFDTKKQEQLTILNKQAKDMSEITKKIRATENDRNLSPQDKRRIIDEYTRQRNKIAMESMKK